MRRYQQTHFLAPHFLFQEFIHLLPLEQAPQGVEAPPVPFDALDRLRGVSLLADPLTIGIERYQL